MDLGEDIINQKLYVNGKLFEVKRSTNAERKGAEVGTQQATGVLSKMKGDMNNGRDDKKQKAPAYMTYGRPNFQKLSLGLYLSLIRDSRI